MMNFTIISEWLDKILDQELPKGIIAFNFNLYEASDGTYDIQLIGSDEFDENDEDWACSDYYTSEENVCSIQRAKEIQQWEEGLGFIKRLVQQYLVEGRNANILKSVSAIGIGFVDGDIEIIYRKRPTYVYQGESEYELLEGLEKLARETKNYSKPQNMKSTLGDLLLAKDYESVPFLLEESFHGWNIICSGVALKYMSR